MRPIERPSILAHLIVSLASRPLMHGGATARFAPRVRAGTRASSAPALLIEPWHRDSLASGEGSAARPRRASAPRGRLRGNQRESTLRSTHLRTPSLGSAHRRQRSSVARPALTSTRADETSRHHAARSRALPSCGQWNATTRSLQRLRSAMRSLRSLITHVARCLRGYRCRTTAAVATHRAGCDHARSWHPLQDTAPRRSTAGRAGTPSTRREPRSAR